jgi:hypothetical protein
MLRVNPKALPVRCVETGNVYPSAKAAARAYGSCVSTTILASCRDVDKMAGGYHWQFVNKAELVSRQ